LEVDVDSQYIKTYGKEVDGDVQSSRGTEWVVVERGDKCRHEDVNEDITGQWRQISKLA